MSFIPQKLQHSKSTHHTFYQLLGSFWYIEDLPSLFCFYCPPCQPNVREHGMNFWTTK